MFVIKDGGPVPDLQDPQADLEPDLLRAVAAGSFRVAEMLKFVSVICGDISSLHGFIGSGSLCCGSPPKSWILYTELHRISRQDELLQLFYIRASSFSLVAYDCDLWEDWAALLSLPPPRPSPMKRNGRTNILHLNMFLFCRGGAESLSFKVLIIEGL